MRRALTILTAIALTLAMVPAVTAAPGSGRVTIARDGFGVPIVTAGTVEGLFYGMGYVAADDRLWQAEILRRSATGTLAELLGPGALAGDVRARLLFGPPERRAEAFEQASSELQTILSSYAAGINARIDEGGLPPEFGMFGFSPRAWTVDDSIAVFFLLGSNFGGAGANELTNSATWQALLDEFGLDDAQTIFGDLFWLDDPDAPVTVPDDGVGPPGRRAGGPPPSLPAAETAAVARQHAAHQAAVDQALLLAGLPADGWSSNAMVIAPRLSRDGAALLLGGPQMGYSTPQINHEVGLRGAGFHVTGMTIAGFPLIPVGVGDGFAWTLTSGGTDNTDIYMEVLNPQNPSQYLFQDEFLDLDCRQEQFGVGGGVHTETLCESVHGPIIGAAGNVAFSLKNVTVGQELDSLEAWLGLGRAKNLRQFSENLDVLAYSFNVLYADRAGNIAFWHIGHVPIRPAGTNPFFPLLGTGQQEWQGIAPFSEMPHSLNPAQAWLANWNNKPATGWSNSSADFWLWGGAHRVNTFFELAEAIGPRSATVDTLKEINRVGGWTTDTPTGQASSVFVTSYLEAMLDAVDPDADPRLPDVVDAMRVWDRLQVDADGDGFYDDPNGTIFNAWWFALAHGVFDEVADLTNRFVLGNLVDRLLRGDDAALPLAYDYLGATTVEEAVTDALIDALDQLTAQFASADPDDWKQPIATINWSPLGVGGVPPTIWMNRGTYNQIVHLRGALAAENVIAPGQSGDPTSPHFADQLELYATWEYKPMRLSARDLVGNVESVVVLQVP